MTDDVAGTPQEELKTVPDPLLQTLPPTPELLRQFAMQSRAAADEMQAKIQQGQQH